MIEKSSGDVKSCIFPFKYFGQTWTQCTTMNDPEGKPWCSTKVNEKGSHVKSGGFWGRCEENCEPNQLEIPKAVVSVKDGRSSMIYLK